MTPPISERLDDVESLRAAGRRKIDWARQHFDLFAEEGYRSQTVSCIENTQGIDVAETIEAVSADYDMVFSNGYGSQLGERTFRIGHMGEHDLESIRRLTDAIEDVAGL